METGKEHDNQCNDQNHEDDYVHEGDEHDHQEKKISFWKMKHAKILWFYLLCVFFVMGDQNLMAPNLTEISVSLHVDSSKKDLQLGGMCSLLFFGFGAPSSIIVGRFIDTVHGRNKRLDWLCLMTLWSSVCCISTSLFTWNVVWLWIWRGMSGMAVGSILPLTASLLADDYPPQQRTAIMAIQSICMGMGISLGQAVAGLLTLSWRWPFFIWGCGSFMSAALLYTQIPAHKQQQDEERHNPRERALDHQPEWTSNENDSLWSGTLILAMLQGAPGCIPWGIVNTYLNDYFSQDCKFTVPVATVLVMIFGVGNFLGMLACTVITDLVTNLRKLAFLGGFFAVMACVPLYFVLIPSQIFWEKALACSICGVLSAMTGPIVKSTIQNVTSIKTRGQAFGMLNIWDDIGRGLGPYVVANLISLCNNQRSTAFLYGGLLGWFICGILNMSMYLTLSESFLQRSSCIELSSYSRANRIDDGPLLL